ncbi:hypothetical protein [Litoreibacter halocynthiae]|uniref:hypothetical protein n=1 Tax=Litoreibacter halocynthiae TaxID=1242689 RepID=UPI0024906EDD|nr:hypothetical protein [Litoreibacter halocynthiae]
MKNVILSFGVVLGLLGGPAIADSTDQSGQTGLETLSEAQLDALVSILSGLPRQ